MTNQRIHGAYVKEKLYKNENSLLPSTTKQNQTNYCK